MALLPPDLGQRVVIGIGGDGVVGVLLAHGSHQRRHRGNGGRPVGRLVVLIDALMIKFLVNLEVLQGDGYAGVSWFRAILVSGFGNAASYFVGYIANRNLS